MCSPKCADSCLEDCSCTLLAGHLRMPVLVLFRALLGLLRSLPSLLRLSLVLLLLIVFLDALLEECLTTSNFETDLVLLGVLLALPGLLADLGLLANLGLLDLLANLGLLCIQLPRRRRLYLALALLLRGCRFDTPPRRGVWGLGSHVCICMASMWCDDCRRTPVNKSTRQF